MLIQETQGRETLAHYVSGAQLNGEMLCVNIDGWHMTETSMIKDIITTLTAFVDEITEKRGQNIDLVGYFTRRTQWKPLLSLEGVYLHWLGVNGVLSAAYKSGGLSSLKYPNIQLNFRSSCGRRESW